MIIHLALKVDAQQNYVCACDSRLPVFSDKFKLTAEAEYLIVWSIKDLLDTSLSKCEGCLDHPEVQMKLLSRVKL